MTFPFEVGTFNFMLQENPSDVSSTGTKLWPSSMVLTRYLYLNRARFNLKKGKRVLEVGAGCGLPGIYLAAQGCTVHSTDLPELMYLLKGNFSLNSQYFEEAKPEVSVYRWGEDASMLGGPFDVVVGCDVVFRYDLLQPLLDTFLAVCLPKATGFISIENRDPAVFNAFLELFGHHFNVTKVPAAKLHPTDKEEPVCVFTLKRKVEQNDDDSS
eukprot:TRINITY_DN4836_c0_g1_i2.p1 TRINITY_DN4836_c0_g1~~TRINITY_DN4836_c0_g1_i2.p1  ORF type:complete len:220 (-),score=49.73 TRINITY_DN4836_c0_g1_i2:168-806(-)